MTNSQTATAKCRSYRRFEDSDAPLFSDRSDRYRTLRRTLQFPLADAAEEMDRPTLRALLTKKADLNAAQVDGMTALHWAAFRDDTESAKLLVDAGANVKAAANAHFQLAAWLLDQGAVTVSRYRSQKHQLGKWLSNFDSALSESENMFADGWRRYWDCGNWVLLG